MFGPNDEPIPDEADDIADLFGGEPRSSEEEKKHAEQMAYEAWCDERDMEWAATHPELISEGMTDEF